MNFNPMQNQINTFNINQFQQMMPPKQMINTFNNNAQESLKDKISLNFRRQIEITCSPDDKISNVIEKYMKKANDNGNDNSSRKFIFNCHALNPSESVRKSGLIDGSIIYVVFLKRY